MLDTSTLDILRQLLPTTTTLGFYFGVGVLGIHLINLLFFPKPVPNWLNWIALVFVLVAGVNVAWYNYERDRLQTELHAIFSDALEQSRERQENEL